MLKYFVDVVLVCIGVCWCCGSGVYLLFSQ